MNEQKEKGGSVGQRRDAMPVTAAFIDLCRKVCGADVVDAQLAIGMQAARDHAHVLAMQGEAAAARWHRTNAHRCTFVAVEGGRTIGLASPWGAMPTASTAASVSVSPPSTPPIGTPGAQTRRGNSTPAKTPVAGLGESPSRSPKAGG